MAKADHQWGHDSLAADLARRLRHDGKAWTWLNATIGAWSGPRPDIMSFPRFRYDFPQIHAYEIKVSRSDLFADLNAEKWRKYLEHCQSVTFAFPHGMAKKEEIPSECGVMLRTGRGWRTERRPTNLGAPCSIQAMAKLLTCHPDREPYPGMSKWESDGAARTCRERFQAECGKRFGQALARFAADSAEGKDPTGRARERADQIVAEARSEADHIIAGIAPLLDMLGLPHDAPVWEVTRKLREATADLSADSRVQRIEAALQKASQVLANAAPAIRVCEQ